tara:strand:- start:94 stop:300 length:207 start_codon:yes stop_codon:yes gene_type:complete
MNFDYSFIYIIHILFAGPLLIYAGNIGKELSEKCKDKSNELLFNTLIGVGLLVVIYHGYKYMKIKSIL